MTALTTGDYEVTTGEVVEEVVSVTEVVTKLRESGLSPDLIANALSIPLAQVRSILVTRSVATPEEQDIAAATRKLMMRGVRKAMVVLEQGTRQEQMMIIKSSLALAGRTLSKVDESDIVDGREILDKLYEAIKAGVTPETASIELPAADGD